MAQFQKFECKCSLRFGQRCQEETVLKKLLPVFRTAETLTKRNLQFVDAICVCDGDISCACVFDSMLTWQPPMSKM